MKKKKKSEIKKIFTFFKNTYFFLMSSSPFKYYWDGQFRIISLGKENTASLRFDASNLTDHRKLTAPDSDGTIALTSDLPTNPTVSTTTLTFKTDLAAAFGTAVFHHYTEGNFANFWVTVGSAQSRTLPNASYLVSTSGLPAGVRPPASSSRTIFGGQLSYCGTWCKTAFDIDENGIVTIYRADVPLYTAFPGATGVCGIYNDHEHHRYSLD